MIHIQQITPKEHLNSFRRLSDPLISLYDCIGLYVHVYLHGLLSAIINPHGQLSTNFLCTSQWNAWNPGQSTCWLHMYGFLMVILIRAASYIHSAASIMKLVNLQHTIALHLMTLYQAYNQNYYLRLISTLQIINFMDYLMTSIIPRCTYSTIIVMHPGPLQLYILYYFVCTCIFSYCAFYTRYAS